ncbi:MAG: hypothetical protein ACREBU_00310 [Nitrososphaera sp.]
MSIKYTPNNIPPFKNLKDLIVFLNLELRRIADTIARNVDQPFDPSGVDQDKFTDGMMIYADGTSFNPGAGRGLYVRNNNQWEKL